MLRREWLNEAKKDLAHLDNPKLEAELLLAHSLALSKISLIAHDNQELQPNEQALADSYLQRRIAYEPLAYIIGTKEFFGLDFFVTPDSLIPRADSETIIDYALENLHSEQNVLNVLDLGTGTGCLALSLLHHRPKWRATLVDIQEKTLAIAKENAQRLGLDERCTFLQADFCHEDFLDLLKTDFDLIVANPAYISQDVYLALEPTVLNYEPKTALNSGLSGTEQLSKIIEFAPKLLKSKGLLLMEHGYDQAEFCLQACQNNLAYTKASTLYDLAGQARVCCVYKG